MAKFKNKVDEAQTTRSLPQIAKQVEDISLRPSREVLQPLREMIVELERGLPPATSGEVLSSRVRW